VASVCVADDIGQRFLGDAVEGHFDGGWQFWQAVGCLHACGNLITGLQGQLTQRGNEAQFIQGGWSQCVNQAANIGNGGLGLARQVRKQRIGQRVVCQAVAGGLQFQGQAGQLGTQAVMQVAAAGGGVPLRVP